MKSQEVKNEWTCQFCDEDVPVGASLYRIWDDPHLLCLSCGLFWSRQVRQVKTRAERPAYGHVSGDVRGMGLGPR